MDHAQQTFLLNILSIGYFVLCTGTMIPRMANITIYLPTQLFVFLQVVHRHCKFCMRLTDFVADLLFVLANDVSFNLYLCFSGGGVLFISTTKFTADDWSFAASLLVDD